MKEAGTAASLPARLFTARVDLGRALDRKHVTGFGVAPQAAFRAAVSEAFGLGIEDSCR